MKYLKRLWVLCTLYPLAVLSMPVMIVKGDFDDTNMPWWRTDDTSAEDSGSAFGPYED